MLLVIQHTHSWDMFNIFDPKIDGISQGSEKLASDIMLGVCRKAQVHLLFMYLPECV